MDIELSAVPVETPDDVNVVVGQAHFIKTVEDLHEVLASAGPHLHFGIAFNEASGPCLVRHSGNDPDLVKLATGHAEAIGAGHVFVVHLRGAYPVSVLNALEQVPEVCTVFCASANPLEVLVAQTDLGRAVIGIVDGLPPAGIETPADQQDRKRQLRQLGYKL